MFGVKCRQRVTMCAVLLASGLVPAGATPEAQHALSEAAALSELTQAGAEIFGTSCVSCHDADGGQGAAPALSGHPSMAAKEHIVRQILRGNAQKGMPAFAPVLDDRKVAAVATYIRNAWDNSYGAVFEADVRKLRAEQQDPP